MSEISLKIQGVEFKNFNHFKLSLNYNGVASVFSFDGFYDLKNPDHKRLFVPLSYPECQVLFDGKVILTGTILSNSSSTGAESELAGISGYTKTGILEDCEIPSELYPLQSDNLTLKEIAEKLIKPFGLKLLIDKSISDEINNLYPDSESDTQKETEQTWSQKLISQGTDYIQTEVNKKYSKTTARETETIKEYLAKLCRQRNIVMTHNAFGNLVFARLNVNKQSIATYTENKPSTKISLTVNGQGMHSKIKVQGQVPLDTNVPVENEVGNILVRQYRPTIKNQTAGDNTDSSLTAAMIRGSELRNIQLTIQTPIWQWFDGKKMRMILPNEIIDVISPQNYLPNRTRFFVESIDIEGDEKSSIATIKAVLPEVYTGKDPKNIFV